MATTTIETYDGNGNLLATQTVAIPDSEVNGDTLRQRATAALATNNTYVNLANPTTAQAVAQVKVLTKECTAVIRLLLGLLDDISGT